MGGRVDSSLVWREAIGHGGRTSLGRWDEAAPFFFWMDWGRGRVCGMRSMRWMWQPWGWMTLLGTATTRVEVSEEALRFSDRTGQVMLEYRR